MQRHNFFETENHFESYDVIGIISALSEDGYLNEGELNHYNVDDNTKI